MGSTKVELVKDLQMALTRHDLTEIQRKSIKVMIQLAKKGHYHDFDTELATPKMALHKDLLSVGLTDIDQKMQNGDYDDEAPTPEQERELMNNLMGKHENSQGIPTKY